MVQTNYRCGPSAPYPSRFTDGTWGPKWGRMGRMHDNVYKKVIRPFKIN